MSKFEENILHRVKEGLRNDWDGLDPSEMNVWQRIASRTNGIVTPGNIVTASGLALGGLAIYKLSRGDKKSAFAFGAASLLTDLFDGQIAHATGTKGEVGKKFDPAKDKLLFLGLATVLAKNGMISREEFAGLLTVNSAIAATSAAAYTAGRPLAPGVMGKVKAAAEGVFIGSSLLNSAWEDMPPAMRQVVDTITDVAGPASITTGVAALTEYVHEYYVGSRAA